MKQRWLSEIETVEREARSVLDDLTPEQANQRPGRGRWSVVQNLAHISKTAVPYLDIMEARLEGGLADRPYRPGILAHLLRRSMEPPPRFRIKTQKTLEPGESLDPESVLAEFEGVHERLAALVRAADDDRFVRYRFRSPYMNLIVIRGDQAVDTLLAHARRHLWQARQARRALGVPG